MDEIYKQNAKIVFHFLYSICKDKNLAEDLTQETFLKAVESIERYDGSCKISTWLCQIARHLLYQYWAKEKRASFVELDMEMKGTSDTEIQVLNRIELSKIWDKVQELPELMGQVVKLKVISDFSYREIGRILNKSENWARVTYYRAKLILMKEVSHYGEDEL